MSDTVKEVGIDASVAEPLRRSRWQRFSPSLRISAIVTGHFG